MKVLCVAEKPSIAKSISGILGGGHVDSRAGQHKYCRNFDFPYRLPPPLGPQHGDSAFTVTSVLGHLTSSDFSSDYRSWHSCDPFDLFEAPVNTFISDEFKPVEKNLQNEARRADLLMIWTDCDREGEHIGYEIVAACRKVNPRIVVKRARFSAIIAAQIHQACRQANDLDMRLVNAVETRQDLDLRLGAAFTRMMTMALQARFPELSKEEGGSVISYGPCQFPTLGFVVDQYNRVQSFVPEPFWHIAVSIERDSEEEEGETTSVNFTWRRGHLFDLNIALLLYEDCIENPMARAIKVETKPTTKFKPLPLTTVELQQSGSRLLGLAPKRVLDLAEKLYQKGFLSYPRTETDQYDKDFDFESLVRKQTYDNVWGEYAQKLLDGAFEKPRNGRKNDKAHPPIHPTAAANNLDADERRVYELVARRFLASCSTNAIGKQTTIEIQIAGEFFSTSGIVVLQRNYLEVYPYDKWTSNPLPDFEEGEEFMPTACELKEGSTSSPSLLTEADLVGLMDKNGIGTDATIAEHIAKIIDRGYVVTKQQQKSKYLVPSQLGIGLVEGYNAIGFDRSLSKPHLRRETEHRMQLICDGQQTKGDVLQLSVNEYKEVFVKARREFQTVVESVDNYLHGQGEAQDALRAAARGGRGSRGGRGGGAGRGGRGARGGGARGRGRDNDDDDDDDADDSDGPPRGGGRGGARGRGTRARGAAASRGTSTRGRGGSTSSRKRKTGAVSKLACLLLTIPDSRDDRSVPTCNCDTDAVMRTAGQSSSNAGRQFYTCPKPQGEQCGFFVSEVRLL
ncbi:hypothetical protein VHUM_03253 [Vanrija humicola]|uniref:DNA topoisomerase n=1 Tax=Vanrija humicola TaxID=5417 RepID=A0A7D8UZN7_VANHU|nr:hypothetical protein VHUM_03253 [Vanrija humicola]